MEPCPVCGTRATGKSGRFCTQCGALLNPYRDGGSIQSSVADPSTTALEAPGHIDGYRLVREIGRGGFGVVFLAVAENGRHVALKRLLPARLGAGAARTRFEEEAALLSRFRHPGLVRYLDAGFWRGTPYLVTEYVEGLSGRDWIERVALPLGADQRLERVMDLSFQLLDALGHAHAIAAHLDLKPENLIHRPDDSLVILDFGLARIADFRAQGRRLLGTAYYVAPEIVAGREVIDTRADIFSVGVVMYEWLTGTLPVGRFDPPSEICQGCPKAVDTVVLKALDPSPRQRWRDIFALRAALAKALGEVVFKAEADWASRAAAGGDPLMQIRRAAFHEIDGQGEKAEDLFKNVLRSGGGGRVEAMAREAMGYPRRKAMRFCILCGTELAPEGRRRSLCPDCRQGRRPRKESTTTPAAPFAGAYCRGPGATPSVLTNSPCGRRWACAAHGGQALGFEIERTASHDLRVDHRYAVPPGIRDMSIADGGTGSMAAVDGGRAHLGRLPGEWRALSQIFPLGTGPLACCFGGEGWILVGDERGWVSAIQADHGGKPEFLFSVESKVVVLRALSQDRVFALGARGGWVLQDGVTAETSGNFDVTWLTMASAAFRAPVVATLGAGSFERYTVGSEKPEDRWSADHTPLCLAVHPDGDWIAWGDLQGRITRRGDLAGAWESLVLDGTPVTALEPHPHTGELVAATASGTIWLVPAEK